MLLKSFDSKYRSFLKQTIYLKSLHPIERYSLQSLLSIFQNNPADTDTVLKICRSSIIVGDVIAELLESDRDCINLTNTIASNRFHILNNISIKTATIIAF